MTYLLIAIILLIIISPLTWLRTSPRQKLIIALRKRATREGLRVQLSRAVDAREDETRLVSVTYLLPWQVSSHPSEQPRMEKWCLIRNSSRGNPAPWRDWQWLGREANVLLDPAVGAVADSLPGNVDGLKASVEGLSVYWHERGSEDDVTTILQLLKQLQSTIRPA